MDKGRRWGAGVWVELCVWVFVWFVFTGWVCLWTDLTGFKSDRVTEGVCVWTEQQITCMFHVKILLWLHLETFVLVLLIYMWNWLNCTYFVYISQPDRIWTVIFWICCAADIFKDTIWGLNQWILYFLYHLSCSWVMRGLEPVPECIGKEVWFTKSKLGPSQVVTR